MVLRGPEFGYGGRTGYFIFDPGGRPRAFHRHSMDAAGAARAPVYPGEAARLRAAAGADAAKAVPRESPLPDENRPLPAAAAPLHPVAGALCLAGADRRPVAGAQPAAAAAGPGDLPASGRGRGALPPLVRVLRRRGFRGPRPLDRRARRRIEIPRPRRMGEALLSRAKVLNAPSGTHSGRGRADGQREIDADRRARGRAPGGIRAAHGHRTPGGMAPDGARPGARPHRPGADELHPALRLFMAAA